MVPGTYVHVRDVHVYRYTCTIVRVLGYMYVYSSTYTCTGTRVLEFGTYTSSTGTYSTCTRRIVILSTSTRVRTRVLEYTCIAIPIAIQEKGTRVPVARVPYTCTSTSTSTSTFSTLVLYCTRVLGYLIRTSYCKIYFTFQPQ